MKKFLPPVILIAVGVFGFGLIYLRSQALEKTQTTADLRNNSEILAEKPRNCIPTFVDGGGPYYLPNAPFRNNLAPDTTTGEKLTVSGKVLASDCTTPLANVVVDVWQANESGNYEDEWYRGQVTTTDQGDYSFTTVVPLGYGAGTAYRPPHIHFKIWQNNQELITSQMFLPASRAQGIEEAYIISLESNQIDGVTSHTGRHNIVLP